MGDAMLIFVMRNSQALSARSKVELQERGREVECTEVSRSKPFNVETRSVQTAVTFVGHPVPCILSRVYFLEDR
jgi:hypothetical protein